MTSYLFMLPRKLTSACLDPLPPELRRYCSVAARGVEEANTLSR
jgi:hypothetical protein